MCVPKDISGKADDKKLCVPNMIKKSLQQFSVSK